MIDYPSFRLPATQRLRYSTSIKAARVRRGLQLALAPALCLFRKPSYQVALMTTYCCWEKVTLAAAPCRQLSSGALPQGASFFLPENAPFSLEFPVCKCGKYVSAECPSRLLRTIIFIVRFALEKPSATCTFKLP